jgi:dTDP-glucose 4,6-dehydratase
MKILVTGGSGFIGSNFIRYMLNEHPDYDIVNLDALTYAGNPANLEDVASSPRYTFIKGDIRDRDIVMKAAQDATAIINFAAESHVDRSIKNPGDFLLTDIYGTYMLLEAVKELGISKYIQISTDEVYGDVETGYSVETDQLRPSSPYAASKAGGDLQVLAAHRTYDLPVMITRCTNNYGPYHYPEKIIPLFITNCFEGKPLPVYDEGSQIRDWLYVEDHCRAIDLVFHQGKIGEIYNIGASQQPEITNLELTKTILALTDSPADRIEYKKGIRPGHDQRYAVDSSKIRALGWKPRTPFDAGIARTVEWFREHHDWWQPIKSGEFQTYYQSHYEHKQS